MFKSVSAATAETVRPAGGVIAFIKSALFLLGGTSIAHAVTLAATPITAKLYGPSAFGIWAGWFALSGVIGNVACLRYDTAVALPESDQKALSVAVLALLIAVVISTIAGVLLIIVWLLSVPGPWQNIRGYTVGVVFGALVIAWWGVLSQWLARLHQISHLARAKILTSGASAGIQIALGFSGAAGALILGDFTGRCAGLIKQMRLVWQQSAVHLAALRWKDLRESLTHYRAHAAWLTPTALLDALGQQAPLLLMLAWYGEVVGGRFALAQRLLALPVALVGQSVAQLFFPAMVRAHREAPQASCRLFVYLSGLLLLIGVFLISFVLCFKESWLVAILGSNWEGIGRLLLPLAILTAAQLLSSTLSQAAIVLGAQKWFFLWVMVWVAASIIGLWIGDKLSSAEGAIWGLTIGSGGAYLLLWTSLLTAMFLTSCKRTNHSAKLGKAG